MVYAKRVLTLSALFFLHIGIVAAEQTDIQWLDSAGKPITVGALITTFYNSSNHMKVLKLVTEIIHTEVFGEQTIARVVFQPHPLPDKYWTLFTLDAESVTIVAQTEGDEASEFPEGDT